MASQRSDPLYVKLSQAGIAAQSTPDHLSENELKVTLYGSEDRARSERYVEVEAKIDRRQAANLAIAIWEFIDNEQRKVDAMRATMMRGK